MKEGSQAVDQLLILLVTDGGNARSGALFDVIEKARATLGLLPFEEGVGTSADGKRSQE
jgi:hypothetical protein